MKRKEITLEAIRPAVIRSTRASAALENRAVPADALPSKRVDQFLASRRQRAK